MLNGDISNSTPPRVIVVIDAVADSEVVESKRLLRQGKQERVVKNVKNMELSHLWNKSSEFGLSIELAAFADDLWTQEHLDKLMDRLDSRGGNPFNYAELYDSIDTFISDFPYRANLKGVIDVRGRVARYGSYGLELHNL